MLWEQPRTIAGVFARPDLASAPPALFAFDPRGAQREEGDRVEAAPVATTRSEPVSPLAEPDVFARALARPVVSAAPGTARPIRPVGTHSPAVTVAEPTWLAPPSLVALVDTPPAIVKPPAPGLAVPAGHQRLRVDSWLAWRAGSGLPQVANGPRSAAYGGSQAGIAARYTLSESARGPALHARASYAPDRPRQAEFAAGLGVRPLSRVPIRVQGELRATRTGAATEFRPAGFAVTEIPPIALPLGLTADAYAQAGWVGGRYATAFADGQTRVTRAVTQAGPLRIAAGAGAWGGAQRFAERIDVGPTLELAVTEGPAPVRLSLDYRMRVAGAATPRDGIAVTLATGF